MEHHKIVLALIATAVIVVVMGIIFRGRGNDLVGEEIGEDDLVHNCLYYVECFFTSTMQLCYYAELPSGHRILTPYCPSMAQSGIGFVEGADMSGFRYFEYLGHNPAAIHAPDLKLGGVYNLVPLPENNSTKVLKVAYLIRSERGLVFHTVSGVMDNPTCHLDAGHRVIPVGSIAGHYQVVAAPTRVSKPQLGSERLLFEDEGNYYLYPVHEMEDCPAIDRLAGLYRYCFLERRFTYVDSRTNMTKMSLSESFICTNMIQSTNEVKAA
ncbi:MAG: hypothetical protein LPH21_15785 [Shewanella sp.]|nr:hypothetical protein [Shewanella sp.]